MDDRALCTQEEAKHRTGVSVRITVEPIDDMWGVYAWADPAGDMTIFSGEACQGKIKFLMGKTKNSCDADFAAEQLGQGHLDIWEDDNPETRKAARDFLTVFLNDTTPMHVEHYADQRSAMMAQVEAAKKAKKKNAQADAKSKSAE
jgi:hypothetical protein